MLKVGDIIDTKKLVEFFGTEKQKNSYYKNNKLRTNIKNSLLKNLSIIANFEEIKKGRNKYYQITYIKDADESLIIQLKNKSTEAIDKKIYNFINSISKDEDEKIILTINQFIEKLNLVKEKFWILNRSYNYLNKDKIEKNSYIEVDIGIRKIYFSLLKNELGNMIKRSLNRLKKNLKLDFKEVIVMVSKSCEFDIANEWSTKILLYIETEALNRLRCKTLRGVAYIGALDEYNRIIKELLVEMGFDDVEYFYKAYEISKLDLVDPIEEYQEKIIDITLNKQIKNMIYNRFKSRREAKIKQEKKTLGFGEPLFKSVETKENFLCDIKKLIDYTL